MIRRRFIMRMLFASILADLNLNAAELKGSRHRVITSATILREIEV